MKAEMQRTTQTPEDVLNELRALVGEAEKIIGQSSEANCESTVEALRERLEAAQQRLADVYEEVRRKVVAGAKKTDATIRQHPYEAMAITLGLGLIAGVLVGRRWGR
jgi:ElaB/YqjD/DUF883 family membrane-anchored ribosome-binding protein